MSIYEALIEQYRDLDLSESEAREEAGAKFADIYSEDNYNCGYDEDDNEVANYDDDEDDNDR